MDADLREAIGIKTSGIEQAHEHSAEVMIPLLQYFIPYDFKILPITISNQKFEIAKNLANVIFNAVKSTDRKICIIASSAFSHYIDPELGKEKDQMVLNKIFNLDTENVENIIKRNNISVCGYGPIMTLMEYSKLCSQNPKINILKQGHSGEISPSDKVVDYISILFSK